MKANEGRKNNRSRTPLYVLPHGISVLGEYPAGESNRYTRVRILAHPFFDAKERFGTMLVRKSRVVMTSIIGRALLRTEVVHHKNENALDDRPENLELTDSFSHNSHHKTGAKHSAETKRKISSGVKSAYRDGRKSLTIPSYKGMRHTEECKKKASERMKTMIASGKIPKPKPPILRGEENPKSVLSREDVVMIRKRAADGESRKSLAIEYGVVIQSIYNVINGVTWNDA